MTAAQTRRLTELRRLAERDQIRTDVDLLKMMLIAATMPADLRQMVNQTLTKIARNAQEEV